MLLVFWFCLGVSSSLRAIVLLPCARQASTVFSGGRYPGRKRQRLTMRWRDRKTLAPYRDFQQEEGGRPATHGWEASCSSQTFTELMAHWQTTGRSGSSGHWHQVPSGRWTYIIQQVQELICQNKILFKSLNSENCMHCCPLQRAESTSHLLSSPAPASQTPSYHSWSIARNILCKKKQRMLFALCIFLSKTHTHV